MKDEQIYRLPDQPIYNVNLPGYFILAAFNRLAVPLGYFTLAVFNFGVWAFLIWLIV